VSTLLKIYKLQMKMQHKYVTSLTEIFHAATKKSPFKSSEESHALTVMCSMAYH